MSLFTRRSIVVALTLILLIAINSNARPAKTETESKYESWLKQTESLLSSPDNSPAGVPLVVIRATALRAGQPIKWELSSSNEVFDRNDQLVRLLDLIREGNIFGNKATSASSDPELFTITVEDAKSSFKTTVSPKDIESNLPVRNMLKLFEVYAASNPNSSLARNSAPTEQQPNAAPPLVANQLPSEPATN